MNILPFNAFKLFSFHSIDALQFHIPMYNTYIIRVLKCDKD